MIFLHGKGKQLQLYYQVVLVMHGPIYVSLMCFQK